MRTLVKKLLAFIMAGVTGWIMATLNGFGISVEGAQLVVDAVETILSVFITALVFFGGDLLLSKVKGLFPGDWAELFWKEHAAEQVETLTTTEAKRSITAGQI